VTLKWRKSVRCRLLLNTARFGGRIDLPISYRFLPRPILAGTTIATTIIDMSTPEYRKTLLETPHITTNTAKQRKVHVMP